MNNRANKLRQLTDAMGLETMAVGPVNHKVTKVSGLSGSGQLQLFHWMGPDPVPEVHRGVELIIRSLARMAGRRHLKKHSQNIVIT